MDSSSPTAPLLAPLFPPFPSLWRPRGLPLAPPAPEAFPLPRLSPTLCLPPRGTTAPSFVALLLPRGR